MTVYEYVKQIITEGVADSRLLEITDFFELVTYASMKKIKILTEIPYIMEFSIRSFYSDKEEVSDDLKKKTREEIGHNYNQYFGKINLCKFKDGVDPTEIFQMFIWIVDGYIHHHLLRQTLPRAPHIHQQQMTNEPLCLDEVGKMLTNWTEMFKQIAYKEEYL